MVPSSGQKETENFELEHSDVDGKLTIHNQIKFCCLNSLSDQVDCPTYITCCVEQNTWHASRSSELTGTH